MIWFARLNFLMCLFISFSSHCHHTLPWHPQLCSSPSSSFDHQNKISSYIFFLLFSKHFFVFFSSTQCFSQSNDLLRLYPFVSIQTRDSLGLLKTRRYMFRSFIIEIEIIISEFEITMWARLLEEISRRW